MIAAMIDANHISERLASLKLEMSDLRVANPAIGVVRSTPHSTNQQVLSDSNA